MEKNKKYNFDNCEIQTELLEEGNVRLKANFNGLCLPRNPGDLYKKIFKELIESAQSSGASIVLDFSELQYMNAKAMKAMIAFIRDIKTKNINLDVIYNEDLLWQKGEFQIGSLFESSDPPIHFLGSSGK